VVWVGKGAKYVRSLASRGAGCALFIIVQLDLTGRWRAILLTEYGVDTPSYHDD